MYEEKITDVQISVFYTGGLTSLMQTVDVTANEIFSIEKSTSDTEIAQRIIFPENAIRISGERLGLMSLRLFPPRKDKIGPPEGIMPLALVIGTCKGMPKKPDH